APHSRIVDLGECAQLLNRAFRSSQRRAHARRVKESVETGEVDVDGIDESTIRGLIWTGPVAIRREEVMQGIYSCEGTAQVCGDFAELRQGLEIADPEIPLVPQGIEVRGQSEQSGTASNTCAQEAGPRADDETARARRIFLQHQVVISRRKPGQRDGQMA